LPILKELPQIEMGLLVDGSSACVSDWTRI
jgi:hypothetical protein